MAKTTVNGPIDSHTHILPGLDDGSPDAATSLALLRREAAQGIETVVLTPHFYAAKEDPRHFLSRRDAALATLTQAMTAEPDDYPMLLVGAEVAYFEGMSSVPALRELCIRGTDLLLLEMPYGDWSERMLTEATLLTEKQGITPIFAHLDRYLGVARLAKAVPELNVLIQLNTSSLLHWRTAHWAAELLEYGRAELLGSDCHNLNTRAPNWTETFKKLNRRVSAESLEDRIEDAVSLLCDAVCVRAGEDAP